MITKFDETLVKDAKDELFFLAGDDLDKRHASMFTLDSCSLYLRRALRRVFQIELEECFGSKLSSIIDEYENLKGYRWYYDRGGMIRFYKEAFDDDLVINENIRPGCVGLYRNRLLGDCTDYTMIDADSSTIQITQTALVLGNPIVCVQRDSNVYHSVNLYLPFLFDKPVITSISHVLCYFDFVSAES